MLKVLWYPVLVAEEGWLSYNDYDWSCEPESIFKAG